VHFVKRVAVSVVAHITVGIFFVNQFLLVHPEQLHAQPNFITCNEIEHDLTNFIDSNHGFNYKNKRQLTLI